MKKIIMLFSVILMALNNSIGKEYERQFAKYDIIFPPLKQITDSLLSQCNDSITYSMSFYTRRKSGMTEILYQRFNLNRMAFDTPDTYGVISCGSSIIYLDGTPDSNLVRNSKTMIDTNLHKFRPMNDIINDEDFHLLLYDGVRLYYMQEDMSIEPFHTDCYPAEILDIHKSIVYIRECNDETPEYWYFTENGERIKAEMLNINIKNKYKALRNSLLQKYGIIPIALYVLVYYNPEDRYYELRYCGNPYRDQVLLNIVDKAMKRKMDKLLGKNTCKYKSIIWFRIY